MSENNLSCDGCQSRKTEEKQSVPRIVHEADMARMERQLKRSWILSIVLIVLLAGTNAAWIYYENQFEDVVTTTIDAQQDGTGTNIVGGGNVDYGAESKDNQN